MTQPGPPAAAVTPDPAGTEPAGTEPAEPGPTEVGPAGPGKVSSLPRAAPGNPGRWWFLIVWAAALAVFMAAGRGRMTVDTKLGVDIDPSDFIARLWPLWDPLEWFGTLQNQYIGYAIPMAPFFLAGQLLHVPVWIIERLWLSLLVATGFAGLVKLATALRVGTPGSRLLGGAVFTLWPAFTILLGSTSASALPGLLLPWAVLPLVPAVQGQSSIAPAAARSGVAIALMSGVNAAATLYVLILPGLYILMRAGGRRRVALALGWGTAVIAATAWWLVPLLLQGRYSFNFLPYIEQTSATDRTMSATAVLRGTGTWTAYLDLGGVWLRSGWAMVTSRAAILASTAAAATGLYGLARRDMPERRWLMSSVAVSALVALSGYFGPLSRPFHPSVDQLFDGTLAPLRSTYKLEPVIAAVLALCCAHALARLWLRLAELLEGSTRKGVAFPAVILVLAGLALPQLTAMVVPANPHGQFLWGYTSDDPMEPLASSPWVERGIVPYGGGGSQQLLETIESAGGSGQQVPRAAG